jgi:hypothetical protein
MNLPLIRDEITSNCHLQFCGFAINLIAKGNSPFVGEHVAADAHI